MDILERRPTAVPGYELRRAVFMAYQGFDIPELPVEQWSYGPLDKPDWTLGGSRPVHRHDTPEQAAAFLADYVRSFQGQGDGLDRAAYEAECAALGVPAHADNDCNSYGVLHGEFSYPEYGADYCVEMRLAYRRAAVVRAEAAARDAERRAAAPPPVMGRSDYSGREVPEVLLMQSSLHGRVAPDEYDELESRL